LRSPALVFIDKSVYFVVQYSTCMLLVKDFITQILQ